MRRRGFTLLELLVALGLTTLLASAAVIYGSASRKQTTLYLDAAKVTQMVLRAKSQAILTYYDPAVISCGYGVRIDRRARTFALFNYVVRSSAECASVSVVGDANYVEVEKDTLTKGTVFADTPGAIIDVLFLPPDPSTLFWDKDGLIAEDSAAIMLATDDGLATDDIRINKRGQVSSK